MQKGVIVAREADKAVAVTTDGRFVDVALKTGGNVGDEVTVGRPAQFLLALFTALFLGLNVLGWGVWGGVTSYWAPVTFLAVDINPSVEFTLNRSKKVVSAYGNNDDGAMLIAGVDFKGMDLEEAVGKVVSLATSAGYFEFKDPIAEALPDAVDPQQNSYNAIMLTVANDRDSDCQTIKETAYAAVDSYFDSMGIFGLILTENFSYELWKETQRQGVDLGKMQLIRLVTETDPSVSVEQAKEMSVRRLNEILVRAGKSAQQELDTAHLAAEREKRIAQCFTLVSQQTALIQKMDSCTFTMEKIHFTNKSEQIRYEMSRRWEEFKVGWGKSLQIS